ncbi:MAG: substrate-binding domain-containing protein [Alphaproteobacteria bacterium]|nr:substrate-binding domain-containing protein [Alphaproteobacteria bacterium]
MSKIDETSPRATLRTLAQITGLGVSTVSQALRDNPEIAEETKRRVKLAAQQAGYRPDRAGVRLRTGKTNVISLILNTEGPNMGLVEQLVFGISEVLSGSPYHLVVTPFGHDDPMTPVRYVVENRLADGVIISRTMPDDQRVNYLIENHMPFATHGRTHTGIEHPYHDYDNEIYARVAVEKLAARGRKNIMHIQPPPGLSYRDHALLGFSEAIQRLGLQEYRAKNLNIDTELQEVRSFVQALRKIVNPPDGYVSHSELSTMAMVAALEEIGQTASDEFDIVTKQCSPYMAWFRPSLIMINEDHRHAGRALAKAVLGAIAGDDVKTLQSIAGPTS